MFHHKPQGEPIPTGLGPTQVPGTLSDHISVSNWCLQASHHNKDSSKRIGPVESSEADRPGGEEFEALDETAASAPNWKTAWRARLCGIWRHPLLQRNHYLQFDQTSFQAEVRYWPDHKTPFRETKGETSVGIWADIGKWMNVTRYTRSFETDWGLKLRESWHEQFIVGWWKRDGVSGNKIRLLGRGRHRWSTGKTL